MRALPSAPTTMRGAEAISNAASAHSTLAHRPKHRALCARARAAPAPFRPTSCRLGRPPTSALQLRLPLHELLHLQLHVNVLTADPERAHARAHRRMPDAAAVALRGAASCGGRDLATNLPLPPLAHARATGARRARKKSLCRKALVRATNTNASAHGNALSVPACHAAAAARDEGRERTKTTCPAGCADMGVRRHRRGSPDGRRAGAACAASAHRQRRSGRHIARRVALSFGEGVSGDGVPASCLLNYRVLVAAANAAEIGTPTQNSGCVPTPATQMEPARA
eukprot:247390-Chlamydomonas_euryale.AAC.9